jgi:glutathione S-transferase
VVQGPFLTGQTMTITDVYAAMLADWYDPAKNTPEIKALVGRVLENPAVSDAWRHHGFRA